MSNRSIFVKNFSANLLLQITTVVSGFVLPPLIILHYGSAANGMLASVKQLIAYLDILEAGIGASSIALLYKPLFEKNVERRNQILAATHRFYRLVGIIFFILLIILAFGYSYLIRQQIPYTTTFMVILLLGMVSVLDFLTIATYRILLQADHKAAVLSYIQAGITLLNVLVCWQLIMHDTGNIGLIDLQIAFFLVSLIRFVLISAYTRKKYPDLSLKRTGHISLKDIPQKRDVFIIKAASLISQFLPLLLISIFCGLKDASVYAIYLLVFNAIRLLLHTLSNGVASIFGQTLVNPSHNHPIRHIFDKYETLYFITIGFLYSCATILALPFLSIYTAKMTDANYYQPTLIFLFIALALTDLRIPADILTGAAGRFKANRNRAITEVSINLVLSPILLYFYGFYGIILGSLIAISYTAISVIFYANKYILMRPSFRTIFKILIILMPLLITHFLTTDYMYTINIKSYVSWFQLAFPLGLFYLLIYWVIYRAIPKI